MGGIQQISNVPPANEKRRPANRAGAAIPEILDALGDPVLLLDRDFRVDFVNQSYRQLFKPHPEATDEFACEIARHVRRTGPTERLTIRHESACCGGRRFLIEANRLASRGKFLVILKEESCPAGPSATVRSQTRVGRMQLLAEATVYPGGVIVATESGDILEANAAFLQMADPDRPEGSVQGLNWRNLTPVSSRLADVRAMAEVKRAGACQPYEKEYFSKTGGRTPVLQTWAQLPGTVELIAFILDLTEIGKSEQERVWLLTRQTALLQAAGEGIFGLDENGICIFINPVACSMLGYTAAECLGRNMHELSHYKHPDGSPYPREECPAYRALLLGKGSRVDEDVIWRKDGTSLSIRLTTEPVIINGLVSGAVVTMSDITGQKRAQAQIDGTTRELARSNSELQQFAYLAAHDLQEPIHTIAGFAKLLQVRHSGNLSATARNYLFHISESAEKMSAMILALLAYAELNARPAKRDAVDCEAALARTLESLDASIRESGALVINGPLPVVSAPETQVIQLFQNLISNGIKYSGQQPVILHIDAVEAGKEWMFSVRDNGIGIACENLDFVFDLFRRSLRKSAPGVGIGLATCRKIVEGLGGRIWVESEVGTGSTFFFTLPRAPRRNSLP